MVAPMWTRRVPMDSKLKVSRLSKQKSVTDKHWEDHLNGIEPSLGIIPINENNECKWGCIDIDVYAEFNHKKLINKIKSMDLPLMVFNSKSGGAHIFLFTKDFVPAKLMRDKLISISAVLGFGGAEVFPKQIELKSKMIQEIFLTYHTLITKIQQDIASIL